MSYSWSYDIHIISPTWPVNITILLVTVIPANRFQLSQLSRYLPIYIYISIYIICIPKKLLNDISKYISTIELDVPLTKWVVPSISPWNSHGIPMFLRGQSTTNSTARSSSAAVNTSSRPFDLCRGTFCGHSFGKICHQNRILKRGWQDDIHSNSFFFLRLVLFCSKIALLECIYIVFVFGPIFHEMFIFWWTNMVNSPSKTRDMGMCQNQCFFSYMKGGMSLQPYQLTDKSMAKTLMNYRVTCEVRTTFLKKLMFKGSLPTRFV